MQKIKMSILFSSLLNGIKSLGLIRCAVIVVARIGDQMIDTSIIENVSFSFSHWANSCRWEWNHRNVQWPMIETNYHRTLGPFQPHHVD